MQSSSPGPFRRYLSAFLMLSQGKRRGVAVQTMLPSEDGRLREAQLAQKCEANYTILMATIDIALGRPVKDEIRGATR
jgi:hypothetical protein